MQARRDTDEQLLLGLIPTGSREAGPSESGRTVASAPPQAADEPDKEGGDETNDEAQQARAARRRRQLRRASLRWLIQEQSPAGVAVNVVTRIQRLPADVAAFWSRPVRNNHDEGPTQIFVPEKTVIVQCYAERDDCWPDCMHSDKVLPELRRLKEEIRDVEAVIRVEEPHLRDTNCLFDEYAEWRYEETTNRQYHRLKRQIAKTEHALYAGTKFEQIRNAQLADELYLAVPVDSVHPHEVADGWGLLWVDETLNVRVVSEPESRDCLPSNRMHLVQNIATAALSSVLFDNALRVTDDKVAFVKPSRAHRKPVRPTLDG